MTTQDEIVFGANTWVYCSQYRRPHQTGWCTVDVRDKLGLGIAVAKPHRESAKAAYEKCRAFGLPIFGEEEK